MGFKVRGYTRNVPQEKVRDYSLFAIATEGTEREPDYLKVYQLGRALYTRMGKVRFEKFVASLPTIEKDILKTKRGK